MRWENLAGDGRKGGGEHCARREKAVAVRCLEVRGECQLSDNH